MLLDGNLPREPIPPLGLEKEAVTVSRQGCRGKQNGELISLAEREFDALATMDQGIPHQQNLGEVGLAILLLEAPSNRLTDLRRAREEG